MLCTKIVLNVRNNICTQHVLTRFVLGIFMYWTWCKNKSFWQRFTCMQSCTLNQKSSSKLLLWYFVFHNFHMYFKTFFFSFYRLRAEIETVEYHLLVLCVPKVSLPKDIYMNITRENILLKLNNSLQNSLKGSLNLPANPPITRGYLLTSQATQTCHTYNASLLQKSKVFHPMTVIITVTKILQKQEINTSKMKIIILN